MAAIDPITREIVRNALASAADEMAMALYRTAYSTIVRDCLDYSTSLCDAEGQMIAQGVTIPLHLGSVPFAMETLLAKYGNDIEEGDVFILNDPFEGGMHIPDIFIVQPVFSEGQRVAFAVSTAHHLDLGGRLPGSSACDNTEIFQEGLRIPWLKLYRRGEADEALFALIRANVRVPQMTIGDLRAQLAACHIGARAIGELIGRYGPDTFARCTADLIDYTERLVRAEIASWPDGSHTFVDYMDSDGVGGPPVRLQVEITVAGDELRADFTGTDPQVSGAINNTLSFTSSVVALCVRSVLREDIPNTAGMFRPLEIVAPPGTVVNGVMPAASSMRGITGFRLADTIFGALAGLLPDRVLAAGEGGNTLVIIGGTAVRPPALRVLRAAVGDLGRAAGPRRQRRAVQSGQCRQQYPRGAGRIRVPSAGGALWAGRRQRRAGPFSRWSSHRAVVASARWPGAPSHPLGPARPPALRPVRGRERHGFDQYAVPRRRGRDPADDDIHHHGRRRSDLPPPGRRRRLGRPAGARPRGRGPGRG